MKYEHYYKEFAQNVALVTRSWHYYLGLFNAAAKDPALLDALNKAPRFWTDQKYFLPQSTFIFLGKIFDSDDGTYSVHKALNSAENNKQHFSKDSLRARKIRDAGEFDGLDNYISQVTELDEEGIKAIQRELRKAKKIWKKLKPIRDKIYAHAVILTEDKKKALFDKVTVADVTAVVQLLINVSNALLQAEMNGRKPDFTQDYLAPVKWTQNDTQDLIKSLLGN